MICYNLKYQSYPHSILSSLQSLWVCVLIPPVAKGEYISKCILLHFIASWLYSALVGKDMRKTFSRMTTTESYHNWQYFCILMYSGMKCNDQSNAWVLYQRQQSTIHKRMSYIIVSFLAKIYKKGHFWWTIW